MKRVAIVLVLAVACSKYGDEEDHPLPNRADGTSSSSGGTSSSSGVTGTSSSSGDTSIGFDGGVTQLPDGAVTATRFCQSMEAKNALRCLDFDDKPPKPFGFDSFLGKMATAETGSLVIESELLLGFGSINPLPQDSLPLTISFDLIVAALSGAPFIAGVSGTGAGLSCPSDQGTLGVSASPGGLGTTFTVTNIPDPLGSAANGTRVHLEIASDSRPAPGKTIHVTVRMTAENGPTTSLVATAPLPAGCTNFGSSVGISGGPGNKMTFDNVLVK